MNPRSWIFYLIVCLLCYALALTGMVLFPEPALGAHLAKIALLLAAVLLLIWASYALLKQEGLSPALLGLKPTAYTLTCFCVGALGGGLLILLIAALFWWLQPYQLKAGMLSYPEFLLELHAYFWGGLGEEIMFRGFPLLVLARSLGTRKALWIVALAFGLFHLPGLEGIHAWKMIFTTGLTSFLYSWSYLVSRTLWTAAGMHMAMNVVLHSVLGLGGKGSAVLLPVFTQTDLEAYDWGFWCYLLPLGLITFLLFRKPIYQNQLSGEFRPAG